jgi:cytochrome c peroxidase
MARVQHLSAHEKDQVQDFRNWVSSGSEETSRSAHDSPIIGLIMNPAASFPSANTAEKSSEPSPETSDTPAAAKGASKAGGSGSSGVEGSKGPSVRLVPFQSMPQSSKEELGKELFDDPLLSLDNMKKLADCMQWSFKFTKVSLLPLLVFVE